MKRFFLICGLLFLCAVMPVEPAHSCVGRILNVAVSNSPDQIVMGNMLSVLINERTGTTVNVIPTGDVGQCHQAVLEGKAQIYIDYVGMNESAVKNVDKNNIQQLYTVVSQYYREQFGMIWLKPFGFEGPLGDVPESTSGAVFLAAPVSTKDVLRKFPVLDRVINKLGTSVTKDDIMGLVGKVKDHDAAEVAREFLKAKKLI